jgi:hypothetical protein
MQSKKKKQNRTTIENDTIKTLNEPRFFAKLSLQISVSIHGKFGKSTNVFESFGTLFFVVLRQNRPQSAKSPNYLHPNGP